MLIKFNLIIWQFRSSGENPVWSSPATGFGPINLPTCGQLRRGRDHSPTYTRSPVGVHAHRHSLLLKFLLHVTTFLNLLLSCVPPPPHGLIWHVTSRVHIWHICVGLLMSLKRILAIWYPDLCPIMPTTELLVNKGSRNSTVIITKITIVWAICKCKTL